MDFINIDSQRFVIAILSTAIYAAMCLAIARRQRIKRRHTAQSLGRPDSNHPASLWRIVYASQSGTAEDLAQQTANTLHLAGIAVQLNALSELDDSALSSTERILFVVSTYGEGDPPDNAAVFAARVMNESLALSHLHYAMLALGDRDYTHFCGFGRELDTWLQQQGAQRLFPVIETHQGDPAAIETWRRQLSHLAGTDDAPDWQGPVYANWRLAARVLLNPGSQGNSVFHIELAPPGDTALPIWESGDLVQTLAPDDVAQPREYSIASLPNDGRIHLLVRLHRHADGTCGAASGWLTQTAQIGEGVRLRLRRHNRFRLGANAARPLILIGNGSGIAGLRGHLKTRSNDGGKPNWLIFGERNASCDYHYRAEIEAWHRAGLLEKLDVVFSRDQPERRYVQDRLLEVAEDVREWIQMGAAIYVCGSLKGMARGVDDALSVILGSAALEELMLAGRYRRDVY